MSLLSRWKSQELGGGGAAEVSKMKIHAHVRSIKEVLLSFLLNPHSVKRSDVTGNPFEWQLGEKNVI